MAININMACSSIVGIFCAAGIVLIVTMVLILVLWRHRETSRREEGQLDKVKDKVDRIE